MANQAINLNLIPDGVAPVVRASQYDVGRVITFALYQGADRYTPPSGAAVEARGRKADGHIFIYESDCVSLSGSTITLTTSQQMTAWAGDALCQFRIKKGDTILATLNFTLHVQPDPAASGDISDSELPAIIAEATEQMNAAAQSASEAAASAEAAAGSAASAGESAASTAASAVSANAYKEAAEAASEAAETSAQEAEAWSSNPPYIGANGNWWTYDTDTGEFEDTGIDASITVRIADITMLDPDQEPTVTNSGTSTDPIFHFGIPRGKGISSIVKKSTSGLVDTYTITYSDGFTQDYTVTNGKSAYQSAVDGGYDRTEVEFHDELANFANYADSAEGSASAAAASETAAATSAANAESAKQAAISAKSGAEAAASDARVVETYVEGKADEIDAAVDRANDISQDLEDKRDEDYYRGSAATVTIGTVETVAPNIPAEVTNSGDSSAAVFNFKIPKGERGDAGDVMEGATESLDGAGGTVPKPLAGQQNNVLRGDGTFGSPFFKDANDYISYILP